MLFRTIAVCSLLTLCCLSGCEDDAPPPPSGVNTEERPVGESKVKAPGSNAGGEEDEALQGGRGGQRD